MWKDVEIVGNSLTFNILNQTAAERRAGIKSFLFIFQKMEMIMEWVSLSSLLVVFSMEYSALHTTSFRMACQWQQIAMAEKKKEAPKRGSEKGENSRNQSEQGGKKTCLSRWIKLVMVSP